MKPKRIQRKRVKGWKMPENTVSVTRPGKWGNPLKLQGDMIYIDAGHRRKHLDKWVFLKHGNIEDLIRTYWGLHYGRLDGRAGQNVGDLLYWMEKIRSQDLSELRGKNLACFCKEDSPCHADVLLELANENK